MNKFVLFLHLAGIIFTISDLLLVPVLGKTSMTTSTWAKDNQLNSDAKRMLRVKNGAKDAIGEERMAEMLRAIEGSNIYGEILSLVRQNNRISDGAIQMLKEFFFMHLNRLVPPQEFRLILWNLIHWDNEDEFEIWASSYRRMYDTIVPVVQIHAPVDGA